MINLEVDKTVPLPEGKKRYPYASMEVGDSFFVDSGKLQVVCNANYRASKRLGMQFIARKEPEGVRVWRTT
jgi:hypothetical protein